jgi:hypothetical protein
MIAGCICVVALLTFLHLRRQKKIRDAYYRQMAAQISAE